MVRAVEELTAIGHGQLLGNVESLDYREIHLVHTVLPQVSKTCREGAQVLRKLLRADPVELRDIECAIDMMRIQIERPAEVDDIPPTERSSGL